MGMARGLGSDGAESQAAPGDRAWYMLPAMVRALFARCFLLCSLAATAGCGSALAQTVALPADGPLLLTLEGRGVQVYRCAPIDGAPAWVLDHPEASLLDAHDKVVGHHDVGPSWQMDDGSAVTGRMVERIASSEAGDVPSLRLVASSHNGTGVLAGVATIRRTRTHGGVAPAQGCDQGMVGATVRVPYTATYTFYGKP